MPESSKSGAKAVTILREISRICFGVILALLSAFILSIIINLTMFWFGPWADPPGFELSVVVFSILGLAFVAWRAIRRHQRTR